MKTNSRFSPDITRLKLIQMCVLLLCGALLSGCETVNSLFSSVGFTGSSNSTSTPVADAAPPVEPPQRSKIAVAPVVGPPDDTSRALQSRVSSALQSQNVSVASQFTDPSEYTLRGYVVASKDKSSTKLSYIWDVTDPSGKRINRITGEEIAALPTGSNDIWSGVSTQIIDKISSKTVSAVVAWLPTQNQVSSAPAPVSSVASTTIPSNNTPVTGNAAIPAQSAASSPTSGKDVSSAPLASPAIPPTQTTGSIGRPGSVLASVPQVTGAPGDGSVALSSAIQRELKNNGIPVSSNDPKSFMIAGVVTVSAPKDGKQTVNIDWNVQDPSGKKLGTVSQKNEVPQGSLDGPWGKTADAAAAAAAQGIIKLLPKTN